MRLQKKKKKRENLLEKQVRESLTTAGFFKNIQAARMDKDEQEAARDALLEDNEDDLEFHITFPSPTSSITDGKTTPDAAGQGEFVFVSRGDPEPVVFLLGWAGCIDKHLSKYSKIYEDFGCITIRYTAPAEYIFFDVEKIRPLAKKLLDLISEMSLEENPVFIHVFRDKIEPELKRDVNIFYPNKIRVIGHFSTLFSCQRFHTVSSYEAEINALQ